MLGQLDRLVSLSSCPTCGWASSGSRPGTHLAVHGFWLYDSDRVLIETFSHP